MLNAGGKRIIAEKEEKRRRMQNKRQAGTSIVDG
jgi:hypothetical protein